MGEVTKEDLKALRAEVAETRELVETTLFALVGKRASKYREALNAARFQRRLETGWPLYRIGVASKVWCALQSDHDLITLEELACMGRDEVASIPGVGPRSLEKFDVAIADRGLTWAEAA